MRLSLLKNGKAAAKIGMDEKRGNKSSIGLILLLSIVVGGSGMVGQLLLLREFVVSFHGNELTLGVILANWLLLEAAGALAAGHRTVMKRHPFNLYLFSLFLYAIFLPAALFYSRGAQYFFFSPLPGEGVGAATLFLATFLIMAPPAFVHGALFPLGCRLLSSQINGAEKDGLSIGKIYLYEIVGTLAGGVLFTLLLAGHYHSLELALAITVLHLLGCLFLLSFFPLGKQIYPIKNRLILQTLTLTAALMLLLFFTEAANYLHDRSLKRQWEKETVAHYENTPYGNIVALYSKGEHTIYYDGRPLITIPSPDLALIGDFVHISAVAHPRPGQVLLLAGGPGGFLSELLKHPVQEVVYVDLDPHLPAFLKKTDDPLILEELQDPRVNVKSLDGRLFLAHTEQRYDLIMLGGFVTPETLQTNRLFTEEFFSLAGRRLKEDGVLAFSVPGSSVFMSPEMLSLNACIYRTLKEHFPHVSVSAGETNIYLASAAPLSLCPELLNGRLTARDLYGEFVAGSYLHYRLDGERQLRLMERLTETEVRLNRDFNPAAFYYALSAWGETFSPGVLKLMHRLQHLALHHYLLAVIVVTVLLMAVFGRDRIRWGEVKGPKERSRPRTAALVWAVFSSGAAGMSLDLLVLFVFQCLYGFVYQMAGMLVASFMAGNFLGGLWALRLNAPLQKPTCRPLPHRHQQDDENYQDGAGGCGQPPLQQIGGWRLEVRNWRKRGQDVLSRPTVQRSNYLRKNIFFLLEGCVVALLVLFYPFTLLLQSLAEQVSGLLIFVLMMVYALCGGFVTGAQFPLAAALFNPGATRRGETAGILYGADLLGGWAAGLIVSIILFPLLGLLQTLLILGLLKLGSLIFLSSSTTTLPSTLHSLHHFQEECE